jgi:hypothetical protein
MSNFRNITMSLWPWNRRRVAYQQWQAQERKLVEARQRLARQLLDSRQQARHMQTDAHQGILRAAQSLLDAPLDPIILTVRNRLERVFALWGKGFFKRLPSPLDIELVEYITHIEKTRQSCNEMGARLRLAQAIMMLFCRTPEFCRPHFFSLALISPESAWLLFHLRQKRMKNRTVGSSHLILDHIITLGELL